MILFLLILLFVLHLTVAQDVPLNNYPIIGILAQPTLIHDPQFPNRQYIAASYVKWVESSGARVVPLSWHITREEANNIIPQLNGLLLPGGDSEYVDNIDYLLDAVIDQNNKGVYMPVWGTCQGFQQLSIYFAKNRDLLGQFPVQNMATHFNFTKTANQTRFFRNMSQELQMLYSSPRHNVTMNFHNLGVGIPEFYKYLSDQITLIATNHDTNGIEHVSAWEHKKYPIFAVQSHPEKTNFEYGKVFNSQTNEMNFKSTTPHTLEAILATQYASNFFVHECRKNANKFHSWKQEEASLIYNFQKVKYGGSFVEQYFFDARF